MTRYLKILYLKRHEWPTHKKYLPSLVLKEMQIMQVKITSATPHLLEWLRFQNLTAPVGHECQHVGHWHSGRSWGFSNVEGAGKATAHVGLPHTQGLVTCTPCAPTVGHPGQASRCQGLSPGDHPQVSLQHPWPHEVSLQHPWPREQRLGQLVPGRAELVCPFSGTKRVKRDTWVTSHSSVFLIHNLLEGTAPRRGPAAPAPPP